MNPGSHVSGQVLPDVELAHEDGKDPLLGLGGGLEHGLAVQVSVDQEPATHLLPAAEAAKPSVQFRGHAAPDTVPLQPLAYVPLSGLAG